MTFSSAGPLDPLIPASDMIPIAAAVSSILTPKEPAIGPAYFNASSCVIVRLFILTSICFHIAQTISSPPTKWYGAMRSWIFQHSMFIV